MVVLGSQENLRGTDPKRKAPFSFLFRGTSKSHWNYERCLPLHHLKILGLQTLEGGWGHYDKRTNSWVGISHQPSAQREAQQPQLTLGEILRLKVFLCHALPQPERRTPRIKKKSWRGQIYPLCVEHWPSWRVCHPKCQLCTYVARQQTPRSVCRGLCNWKQA